ncbi:DNA-binding transcriptional LysR family regulator [Pseudomonas psychrotolerans]|nr:DNA-binding transcriptional LysR family regulator [Pseudomonas psychrotolerans]
MRHLDTDALATFIAVIDHGGFTAAAERIGKTQAAVSLIVSRLEERVGKRLLERSRKGVSLTAHGEILMGYARRMLILEDEALCALECKLEATRVRIGMPDDYLDSLGAWLLQTFAAQHPEIQVEILCDFSKRLEPQVQVGDLDLAIVTREAGRPSGELLCAEAQVWCSVVGKRPEREQVLPLSLFADSCRARPGILAALDEAGRPWRIVSSSSQSARGARRGAPGRGGDGTAGLGGTGRLARAGRGRGLAAATATGAGAAGTVRGSAEHPAAGQFHPGSLSGAAARRHRLSPMPRSGPRR